MTAPSTAPSAARAGAPPAEPAFQRATADHDLALVDGAIVCRNAKGKLLKLVPKPAKESDAYEALAALRDWLARHEQECRSRVEAWMLGSLTIPSAVVQAVWADPAWRAQLVDAVVQPSALDGTTVDAEVGFLRSVDADRGLGVVDLDGESAWIVAPAVVIPHPVLLDDLDDLRGFALELDVRQTIDQLMREVHHRPADLDPAATAVADFAAATFQELRHATGRAAANGFRVRGGFAVCSAFDRGTRVEARYWIGADDPSSPAYTGDLLWVDGDEKALPLGQVGPVAYSEGVRMASAIHAGRQVDDGTEAA